MKIARSLSTAKKSGFGGGYEWVKDMPTMIFFNSLKENGGNSEFPEIDERVAQAERSEIERIQQRVWSFEELECNGNLILREWLEKD